MSLIEAFQWDGNNYAELREKGRLTKLGEATVVIDTSAVRAMLEEALSLVELAVSQL